MGLNDTLTIQKINKTLCLCASVVSNSLASALKNLPGYNRHRQDNFKECISFSAL